MSGSSILGRLKDRKVFQYSVAYVAAAWVIAQVAEVVAEPWGLPLGWIRVLHVLLVAGFPIIVILAWFHGDRGHQRVTRSEVALLAIVVAGMLVGVSSLDLSQTPPATSHQPDRAAQALIDIPDSIPRLAVLAFSNLGAPADAFFADGITAELGSRLSGLTGLALLSPSSAKAWKGSEQTPREFGRSLGADFVLSGTVLWDRSDGGDTSIRVIPEVIRVADDTQIWSTQINRSFENALSVQSDIATQVVEHLRVEVTRPERERMERPPTDNPLAYEAYLKGIQVLPEGHGAEQDFRQARVLLEQATLLDPGFLQAWTELAQSDFGLYWFGYDTLPERLEIGLASVEKALALDPDSPQARLAMGEYHYRNRDWSPALAEYSVVYRQRPNDADVLKMLGLLWRRQGLFEQGIEALTRAAEMDPLNTYLGLETAYTLLHVGQDERAFQLNEKSRLADPDEDWSYLMGAMICWTRGGPHALDCARDYLQRFPESLSTYPAWSWNLQLLFEGNPSGALERIDSYPDPALVMQSVYLPVELVRGYLLMMLGDDLQGRHLLEQAESQLRISVEQNPTDERLYVALGLAYAYLGRREEAIEYAERATAIMSPERDALRSQDIAYYAIQVYAIAGDDQRALDALAVLLGGPTIYRNTWWTHHPAVAHLRENPRFRSIVGLSDLPL